MRMQTGSTPAQRAAKYLKRIAALTGAKPDGRGKYRLKAGRTRFLVDPEFIRIVSGRHKSTCFYVLADPEMPNEEVVASALLQLRNNPRLFELWKQWRGLPFKANGRMFKGRYWSDRDET
jgi:hypothetical protein